MFVMRINNSMGWVKWVIYFLFAHFGVNKPFAPIILFIRNARGKGHLEICHHDISLFFFSGRFHTFKYESNSSGYNCIILSDRHLFHFPGSST